jgi:hypothetical protein
VNQNCAFKHTRREFRFDHIGISRIGDSAHFHVYSLEKQKDSSFQLNMMSRLRTNANGIDSSRGLQADPNVELAQLIARLESKITDDTLLTIA